ncbi:MAG: hypothetical protein IJM07_05530, partial [Pyramidobacter sp.]|nr:hypothetical protein [Pyramidobacter sp.]
MKLFTFKKCDSCTPEVGVLRDGALVPVSAFGLTYASMNELIEKASPAELKKLAEGAYDASARLPLEGV